MPDSNRYHSTGNVPQPSLRSTLGRSLRSFADGIPDLATQAAQELLKENERNDLRGEFIDFVTSGAVEIAAILKDRKAAPEYFSVLRFGEPDPRMLGGFMLRNRIKYGGTFRNPKHDIEASHHRRSETNSIRKLIVMAGTGDLAVAGYRGGKVILDKTPGPSQWFNDLAIHGRSDYKALKNEAQSDMERTLHTYLSKS